MVKSCVKLQKCQRASVVLFVFFHTLSDTRYQCMQTICSRQMRNYITIIFVYRQWHGKREQKRIATSFAFIDLFVEFRYLVDFSTMEKSNGVILFSEYDSTLIVWNSWSLLVTNFIFMLHLHMISLYRDTDNFYKHSLFKNTIAKFLKLFFFKLIARS